MSASSNEANRSGKHAKSSLRIAMFLIAISCIGLLLSWSLLDASFPLAVHAIQCRIGWEASPIDVGPSFHWHLLGWRVALILPTILIGVAATVILVAQATLEPQKTTALQCALLILFWWTLCSSRNVVDEWRTQQQVKALLPQFKLISKNISAHWPKFSGTIQSGVDVSATDAYPDVLLIRDCPKYPFTESLGRMISRSDQGVICFDLSGAVEYSVEYHPNGTVPKPRVTGLGNSLQAIRSTWQIDDEWFLVRYGQSHRSVR